MQNHAESSRNFVKNTALNPKRATFDQTSEIWAHMGPARALEESVGPARALEEREKFRKNAPLFLHILYKNIVFNLQTTVFDGFNVLLSFLAENDTERL